jgi:hypothetical protein
MNDGSPGSIFGLNNEKLNITSWGKTVFIPVIHK